MANRTIFQGVRGKLVHPVDALNHAGGPAYALGPKQLLAQIACTGTFNGTFYANGEEQLDLILDAARKCTPEYVAKTAIYGRERGFMKDAPALLVAHLSTIPDSNSFESAFVRVINNGKMLRNFVQIMRSGVVGRKSMGTRPRRMVRNWLAQQTPDRLINASVGDKPSLADVIKMVHPTPADDTTRALYGWLIGKWNHAHALPDLVLALERFRKDPSAPVPNVEFRLLTGCELTSEHWKAIARNATWRQTRINLNTFSRHGVFEDKGLVDMLATRLGDSEQVARAKVFPYELMAAYFMSRGQVPQQITQALHDAMEHATRNVPAIDGDVVVAPDISGSMDAPVTGERKGATSAVRCRDAAALIASVILRANPSARILPFSDKVVVSHGNRLALDPRDTIMTNAQILAGLPSGGTDCSKPLALLNKQRLRADLVIYVSDNESWADRVTGRGTGMMEQWRVFKASNPSAKLVCIDLTPNSTAQAAQEQDILRVGGFSDAVFDLIRGFVSSGGDSDFWVKQIESVSLGN